MDKKEKSLPEKPLIVPTTRELFTGFLSLSLGAFGGALPVAHRTLVTQRKWLNSQEFFEVMALCHLLPGPNVLNMAVVVGSRFHKVKGAFFAVLGLMGVPMLIIIALGHLYARYKTVTFVQDILRGVNPAAAGLMMAMILQMASPLFQRHWPFFKNHSLIPFGFMVLSFLSVGVFHFSLLGVLLILTPFSMAYVWGYSSHESQ